MKRIEYRTTDKSMWGDGPWQNEPDKIQWQNKDTGYPCLIVRNSDSIGALCGYVGVPKGHPLYGVDYSQCPVNCGDTWCEHRPESRFDVHGGLTFAGSCAKLDREQWLEHAKYLNSEEVRAQAAAYPQGDAARGLKLWGPRIKDYQDWRELKEARSICHKVEAGEDDQVWWFGFDCAHAGDLCPGMTEFKKNYGFTVNGDQYRDVDYVAQQVAQLAKQLKAMEEKNG